MPLAAWIGIVSIIIMLFLHTAAFSFWMGRLSSRVQRLEDGAKGDSGMLEKVIRLEEKVAHVEVAVNKLVNTSENVNRQLGNIAMGRMGAAFDISDKT